LAPLQPPVRLNFLSLSITANEVKVGTYPAGQVVSLGSFWQSQAFEIKGANVPRAYAYIPNQR
jgi:hypothetical protein